MPDSSIYDPHGWLDGSPHCLCSGLLVSPCLCKAIPILRYALPHFGRSGDVNKKLNCHPLDFPCRGASEQSSLPRDIVSKLSLVEVISHRSIGDWPSIVANPEATSALSDAPKGKAWMPGISVSHTNRREWGVCCCFCVTLLSPALAKVVFVNGRLSEGGEGLKLIPFARPNTHKHEGCHQGGSLWSRRGM